MADQLSSTSPEPRKSPSSKVKTASQPTNTTSTNPTDEPKTSSPSRATTQSPPSSKPASPYRRTAQSKSPPQPFSPSHAAPQAQSTLASPSTPKRASQPRSPSRLTSRSPKQGSSSSPKGTQPISPSKESRQPTQEISNSHEAPILASNEKDPNSVRSQQEPQLKPEVKSDSANDLNGQTEDGTSFKHDAMEVTPSQSLGLGTTTTPAQCPETPAPSKSLVSSNINGENEPPIELNPKPEETKDVKEVVQATNTEANEETKKEVNEFLTPKSGSEAQVIEKAEIPSKPDQMHKEKQEALDTKKRSTISCTHNKSALTNGEHVPLHKIIRDDMSTFVNQMAIGDTKRAIYDRPVSVITLAGENRGASMQMESNSSEKEKPVYIHRSYKINHDESAEATTDGEASSEGKNLKDAESTEDQPKEAYLNNNSQGINNSIVFNSSITEGNPGVHMVVTHAPKEPIQSIDKTGPPQARKAEFNMTRSDKLTYEPTVRRRCLRGLFLETSDSDAENSEKPRRHGCRVGCKQMDKENDIDVL